MPGTFKDIAALERFLASPQGQGLIAGQSNTQRILTSEAERFKGLLQTRINQYYASHEPQVYDRTFKLQNALRINPKVEVVTQGMQIVVYFADEMVKRRGIFSGNVVNSAVLINGGWEVKQNVWFRHIKHFGWQEASHFIEKAIVDFYNNNPYKIRISIHNHSF